VQEAAEAAQDAANDGDWAGAGEALQTAQEAFARVKEAEQEAEGFVGAPEGMFAAAGKGKAAPAKKDDPKAKGGKVDAKKDPPAKAKSAMAAWRDS
jgi:hypothetical protein